MNEESPVFLTGGVSIVNRTGSLMMTIFLSLSYYFGFLRNLPGIVSV